ncbi:MAG: PAS domain S-box protein [Flammeovirgaceae bacterium]
MMDKERTIVRVPLWATLVDQPILLLDQHYRIIFTNTHWQALYQDDESEFLSLLQQILLSSSVLKKLKQLQEKPQGIKVTHPELLGGFVLPIQFWKEKQADGSWYTWGKVATKQLDILAKNQHATSEFAPHLPNIFYQCAVNPQRTPLFISEHFEELTGYKPSTFVGETGKSLASIIYPDDCQKVLTHFIEAIHNKSNYDIAYRIICKDGSIIWIADYGQIVEVNGQQHMQGIWHDITFQKTANLQQIKNNHHFKSIVDAIQEGIVVQDVTGEITFCNDAALQILGLTYAQISGRDSFDPNWKTIREDGSNFPSDMHPAMRTLKTGKPQNQVIMGVQRPTSNTLVWISINSYPIMENGTLTGVVASFSDITHLKVSQRIAIRDSKRFQKLFESINYPVLILNVRAQMIMFNPALRHLFGYEDTEIIRQQIGVLLQKEDASTYTKIVLAFFNTQQDPPSTLNLDNEIYAQKKDGTIFPIQATLSPLNYDGERYVLCIIQDLTADIQRNKLEKAHKKITDSLRYAQRIQLALLDNHNHLLEDFEEAMIFFSPKDIVSGDFYWYERIQQLDFNEKTLQSKMKKYRLLVVADCTGHGVPGAFMAALGNAFLHEIINEHHILEPQQILKALDQKVKVTLRNRGGSQMQDGMDVGIVLINEETKEAYFSGAKHPLYLVREQQIQRIKGSAFSIGGKHQPNTVNNFKKNSIQLQAHDRLYMVSDGFQDQFGGKQGRKYLRKNLQTFILKISELPMQQQKEKIAEELVQWKMDEPQTDDILIIGVKI